MMKKYSTPLLEVNNMWQHDVLAASYIEKYDKTSDDIGNWGAY